MYRKVILPLSAVLLLCPGSQGFLGVHPLAHTAASRGRSPYMSSLSTDGPEMLQMESVLQAVTPEAVVRPKKEGKGPAPQLVIEDDTLESTDEHRYGSSTKSTYMYA